MVLIPPGLLAWRTGALAGRLWRVVDFNRVCHDLHIMTRHVGDERATRGLRFTTPHHTN
jgi:hypothetical protein